MFFLSFVSEELDFAISYPELSYLEEQSYSSF
jgi:hypothetical protein